MEKPSILLLFLSLSVWQMGVSVYGGGGGKRNNRASRRARLSNLDLDRD